MFNEFKKFLFRGNVIDLAVGVVVGAAFTGLVNAIVADFLNPLISAIVQMPDLSSYAFTIHGSRFAIGHLANTVISLVLVAFAVFFFVVKPANKIMSKMREEEDKPVCPACLSEIKKGATRCPFCTTEIAINKEESIA